MLCDHKIWGVFLERAEGRQSRFRGRFGKHPSGNNSVLSKFCDKRTVQKAPRPAPSCFQKRRAQATRPFGTGRRAWKPSRIQTSARIKNGRGRARLRSTPQMIIRSSRRFRFRAEIRHPIKTACSSRKNSGAPIHFSEAGIKSFALRIWSRSRSPAVSKSPFLHASRIASC